MIHTAPTTTSSRVHVGEVHAKADNNQCNLGGSRAVGYWSTDARHESGTYRARSSGCGILAYRLMALCTELPLPIIVFSFLTFFAFPALTRGRGSVGEGGCRFSGTSLVHQITEKTEQ